MTEKLLKGVDGDEVDDIILQLEASFGIRLGLHELEHVATFGEFCDIVLAKLPQAEASDCTSQQAFYKLRRAFKLHAPAATLAPATALDSILPRSVGKRKQLMRSVENELGVTLDIIGASDTVSTVVFFAFILSFAAFFSSWHLGAIGLLLSFISACLAGKFGNTLQIKTIKDVVAQMVRENYTKSRRDSSTVNRSEIVKQIQAIFSHELGLELSILTQEARF